MPLNAPNPAAGGATGSGRYLKRLALDVPGFTPPALPAQITKRGARARLRLGAALRAEFEQGYRYGKTGGIQPPCDALGFPVGLYTWPLDRRNAWWNGFNLGHVEREPAR